MAAVDGSPPDLWSLLDLMNAQTRRTIQRDRCGDWRIIGRNGHIYTDGTGFLLCLAFTNHPKAWTSAKKRLSRFQVAQDGDDEGCIRIIAPTVTEARILRVLTGVKQRRPASTAEHLKRFHYK